MLRLIPLLLIMQVIASATTIYVETTGFSSPYYYFYLDEAKTAPFNFINEGSDSLVVGQTYTFTRLNSGHPFEMYLEDSNGGKIYLVNGIDGGESETFTLSPDIDYSSYTNLYGCTITFHSFMEGNFNISYQQISSFQTEVSIVSTSSGNKYTLNENNEYFKAYGMGLGTYIFKNVPESHPMAVSNATNISYVGDVDKKLVDGNGKDYYYGDLTVYVSGDFGTASLICLEHGYMGGENMLVYGQEYALAVPSTKTLEIYSSSDLTTWDLLQSEAVESAEDTLFLKATLSD